MGTAGTAMSQDPGSQIALLLPLRLLPRTRCAVQSPSRTRRTGSRSSAILTVLFIFGGHNSGSVGLCCANGIERREGRYRQDRMDLRGLSTQECVRDKIRYA